MGERRRLAASPVGGRYRGADRRAGGPRAPMAIRSAPPTALVWPLLVAVVGVEALSVIAPPVHRSTAVLVCRLFGSAGCALAAVAALVLLIRSRLTGLTWPTSLSVAFTFMAAGMLIADVVPDTVGAQSGFRSGTIGAFAAGLALALWTAARPPVDTKSRPGLYVVGGIALAIAVSATNRLAPIPWRRFGLTALLMHGRAPGIMLVGVVAVAAGVAVAVRALPSGAALATWGAATTLAAAHGGIPAAVIGAAAIRALALAVPVAAGLHIVANDYEGQRAQLFDHELSERVARAQARALDEVQRGQRHDASNVLMAVQTAGLALQRNLALLSDADRATLSEILRTGVDQLNDIVTGVPAEPGQFAATELEEPLRRWAAGIGVDLTCSLPPGAVVDASLSHTLEALRTMVQLAAGPGDGGAVRLDAAIDRGCVRLHLAAMNGGGVSTPSDAEPIEVLVVAQIIRGQRGRVATACEGGALTFDVWLPCSPQESGPRPGGPALGEQAVDGVQGGRHVIDDQHAPGATRHTVTVNHQRHVEPFRASGNGRDGDLDVVTGDEAGQQLSQQRWIGGDHDTENRGTRNDVSEHECWGFFFISLNESLLWQP